jgi:hypothetical protein
MRYLLALVLIAISFACAPSTRTYGSHYKRGQTWEVTNGSRCTAHVRLTGPGGAVIQKYEIPPGAIDWIYIPQDRLYLSFTTAGPNDVSCDERLIRVHIAKGGDT